MTTAPTPHTPPAPSDTARRRAPLRAPLPFHPLSRVLQRDTARGVWPRHQPLTPHGIDEARHQATDARTDLSVRGKRE